MVDPSHNQTVDSSSSSLHFSGPLLSRVNFIAQNQCCSESSESSLSGAGETFDGVMDMPHLLLSIRPSKISRRLRSTCEWVWRPSVVVASGNIQISVRLPKQLFPSHLLLLSSGPSTRPSTSRLKGNDFVLASIAPIILILMTGRGQSPLRSMVCAVTLLSFGSPLNRTIPESKKAVGAFHILADNLRLVTCAHMVPLSR